MPALIPRMGTTWLRTEEVRPDSEVYVCISIRQEDDHFRESNFASIGFFEDGNKKEDDSIFTWQEENLVYNDKEDCNYVKKGWYEANVYSKETVVIPDRVIAWMPLPKPYRNTE